MMAKSDDQQTSDSQSRQTCAICLGNVGYELGALAGCSHVFCFICIFSWSKVTNNCPLCKTEFLQIEKCRDDSKNIVSVVKVSPKKQKVAEVILPPEVENAQCQYCGSSEDEEILLLCDGCDKAYHTYCLQPPLREIPEGDWFCEVCSDERAKATAQRDTLDGWLQPRSQQNESSESSTETVPVPSQTRRELRRFVVEPNSDSEDDIWEPTLPGNRKKRTLITDLPKAKKRRNDSYQTDSFVVSDSEYGDDVDDTFEVAPEDLMSSDSVESEESEYNGEATDDESRDGSGSRKNRSKCIRYTAQPVVSAVGFGGFQQTRKKARKPNLAKFRNRSQSRKASTDAAGWVTVASPRSTSADQRSTRASNNKGNLPTTPNLSNFSYSHGRKKGSGGRTTEELLDLFASKAPTSNVMASNNQPSQPTSSWMQKEKLVVKKPPHSHNLSSLYGRNTSSSSTRSFRDKDNGIGLPCQKKSRESTFSMKTSAWLG